MLRKLSVRKGTGCRKEGGERWFKDKPGLVFKALILLNGNFLEQTLCLGSEFIFVFQHLGYSLSDFNLGETVYLDSVLGVQKHTAKRYEENNM